MSYTDEVVKAKLSALNETQESIVTVAQWIMFHRYGLVNVSKAVILTVVSGDMQTVQRPCGYRN